MVAIVASMEILWKHRKMGDSWEQEGRPNPNPVVYNLGGPLFVFGWFLFWLGMASTAIVGRQPTAGGQCASLRPACLQLRGLHHLLTELYTIHIGTHGGSFPIVSSRTLGRRGPLSATKEPTTRVNKTNNTGHNHGPRLHEAGRRHQPGVYWFSRVHLHSCTDAPSAADPLSRQSRANEFDSRLTATKTKRPGTSLPNHQSRAAAPPGSSAGSRSAQA
jgi:hypothetical protein